MMVTVGVAAAVDGGSASGGCREGWGGYYDVFDFVHYNVHPGQK
jgi:hypothetical protein